MTIGHERSLIVNFANTCNISMSATLHILYQALTRPVEIYLKDIETALALATCLKKAGGVAEIVVFKDG